MTFEEENEGLTARRDGEVQANVADLLYECAMEGFTDRTECPLRAIPTHDMRPYPVVYVRQPQLFAPDHESVTCLFQ